MCRKAIVLSGHTHHTSWWHFVGECGSYSEFTANSVWKSPELATAVPLAEEPARYGEWTLAKLTKADESKAQDYRTDIAPFKKDLKEYFFCLGAGHFRLNVSDERVTMDYFPGDAVVPARTFVLKSE